MASIDRLPTGRWRARIRRQGYPPLSRTFKSQQNAAAWARKTESEQERGVWRDLGDADSLLLTAALTQYVEAPATKEHRGYRAEQSVARILADEPIAKLPLAQIDERSIQSVVRRWQRDGLANATIRRRLVVLSSVIRHAAPKMENPVSRTKPKEGEGRSRRVSDAELSAIRQATGSPSLPAILTLAVETAMRRGELVALTWGMADLDSAVIHLPASVTKNGKARDVPLSPAALATLSKLRPRPCQRTAPVFGVRQDGVTQSFVRAVRRARAAYEARCCASGDEPDPAFLHDLRFHDLRHEATTRLARIFQLHELMKITGHQSARMLSRYYNPTAADFARRLRDAAGAESSHTQPQA